MRIKPFAGIVIARRYSAVHNGIRDGNSGCSLFAFLKTPMHNVFLHVLMYASAYTVYRAGTAIGIDVACGVHKHQPAVVGLTLERSNRMNA